MKKIVLRIIIAANPTGFYGIPMNKRANPLWFWDNAKVGKFSQRELEKHGYHVDSYIGKQVC